MNVLLVYPESPITLFSNKQTVRLAYKKAVYPPLGLLTVSSMLPSAWNKRLVDMNFAELNETDLEWADYVFISAMLIQRSSAFEVIKKAKSKDKFIIAGGRLFTYEYKDFKDVDCFVLNEAEITIPLFLSDLEKGEIKHIYSSDEKADISKTPIPDWSLINVNDYLSLSMQVSRGCPHNCEFCDIIVFNGRVPRVKTIEQVIDELNAIYNTGFKGSIYIVDDNFFGNKTKAKQILKELTKWIEEKKYPFHFDIQATVSLADDNELIDLMKKANFTSVSLGIESPDEESLISIGKFHNTKIDLKEKVKILQRNGFEVLASFILGFDTDTPGTFDRMIKFIQDSGIVRVFVVLLIAYPETQFYKRLQKEGRILNINPDDNYILFMNFIPKMDKEELLEGYSNVVSSIYSRKNFYYRSVNFLNEFNKFSNIKEDKIPSIAHLRLFLLVLWKIGIWNKGMYYFWKLFARTIITKPHLLPEVIKISIFGYNFRKDFQQLKSDSY